MTPSSLDTPAVLIDEVIAQRNIAAYQAYCDEHQLALRPHVKTHKLPHFARQQIQAGAVGITCQKISEAAVMADAGLDDILITYNIVGATKLQRLKTLAQRLQRLCVVADSTQTINGLAGAFSDAATPLRVLVECETGAARCGVTTVDEAVQLAQQLQQSDGLLFEGLMTYPPRGGIATVREFMSAALIALQQADIHCPTISSGGSPDMWMAADAREVTEQRTGTYIYNDRYQVEVGTCNWDDCALRVVTTVVSTPTDNRAVIDAGSKTLTSDLRGLDGYGFVVGHEDVKISRLSEEHGVLEWTGKRKFEVGQQIEVIPNHVCVVSNMVDIVWIKKADGSINFHRVTARGSIT